MRGRLFYGWVVVGAVFVVLGVSSGISFYGLSVYLEALSGRGAFSVGAISGATAVFFLVSGVIGLAVARYIESRDVRWTLGAGGIVGAVALLLLGHVTQIWQVYAVYALLGASFAASSLVPGTTLVTRWFAVRRSVALSIASTGLSAGGVVLTPVVAALVNDRGLSAVAPLLALIYLLGVVPVAVLLVRPHPGSIGTFPDGIAPLATAAKPHPGTPLAVAQRSRFYWAVTGAHTLGMLAQVGGIAHLYNLVADRVDPATGATALSLLAISSLIGRLIGGAVVSKLDLRDVYLAMLVVQAGALALLATADGAAALLGGSVLFGLTVGNLLMVHPLLLVERFGISDYSAIYSRSTLVATIGIALGPASIGLLRDATGGYTLALLVAGAASLVGIAVLVTSGRVHPQEQLASV